MRALVYTGPNALELREESVPTAVDGEVVVKVEAVGICGSDMHAYHGYDSRRPAPLILGHEAAGRIVSGPRAGERITINPLMSTPSAPTPSRVAGIFRRRAKSCRCPRARVHSPSSSVYPSAMWRPYRIICLSNMPRWPSRLRFRGTQSGAIGRSRPSIPEVQKVIR